MKINGEFIKEPTSYDFKSSPVYSDVGVMKLVWDYMTREELNKLMNQLENKNLTITTNHVYKNVKYFRGCSYVLDCWLIDGTPLMYRKVEIILYT